MIEETLDAETVERDRGGWRITRTVAMRHETLDDVQQLHLADVERRPIGRLLEAGDVPQARLEGKTYVVPVMEEVLVTETRLRLVEEVRITPRTETIRKPRTFALRKEDVRIERLEPEDASGTKSPDRPTAES